MSEFQMVISITMKDGLTEKEQKDFLKEAQNGVINGIGHTMAYVEDMFDWQYRLQKLTPPDMTYVWTDITVDEAFPDE